MIKIGVWFFFKVLMNEQPMGPYYGITTSGHTIADQLVMHFACRRKVGAKDWYDLPLKRRQEVTERLASLNMHLHEKTSWNGQQVIRIFKVDEKGG
jgi:hypothetical protein